MVSSMAPVFANASRASSASALLSSTSNQWVRCIVHARRGKGQCHLRALSQRRLNPNLAAMAFDDLFDDGKSNAAAFVFSPLVQALKHEENAIEVAGINSDAIIFYADSRHYTGSLGGDA